MVSYLERQVLEEVRGTVGLVGLGSGAGINPHANSRSLGPWRVLSSNLVIISQSGSQHDAMQGQLALVGL